MKSHTAKIGTVIQGPLLSEGKTGAQIHVARGDIDDSDMVTHNCVDYVIANAKSAQHHGPVYIVLRETDPENLVAQIKGEIGDDAVIIAPRGQLADGPQFRQNNKNLWLETLLIGAEKCKEDGVTLVLKLRTDQLIDVDLLVEESKARLKKGFKIVIPWIVRNRLHTLTDFYYGCEIDTLIACLKKNLAEPSDDFVHTDLFLTWSRVILKSNKSIEGYKTAEWNRFISKAYRKAFIPFSKELYDTVYWRGEKLDDPIEAMAFSENGKRPTIKADIKKRKKTKPHIIKRILKKLVP